MKGSSLLTWFAVLSLSFATPINAHQESRGGDASLADAAAAAGGIASAFDDDGVPTFIWGTGQSAAARGNPGESARRQLERFARAFKSSPAELANAVLVQVHEVPSGGYIAHFRQHIGGLDVYGSDVKVLLGDDERLVAISGRPRAVGGIATSLDFQVTSQQALATALTHLSGIQVAPTSIVRTVAPATDDAAASLAFEWFQLVDPAGPVLADAAPVKRILFPVNGALVAAYDVQFYAGTADSNDSAAFRYFVAGDGRVLSLRDLTTSERSDPTSSEFKYRVWADTNGERRPFDGPQADFTPHPTGVPDDTEPPFVPANLVPVSGLNNPDDGKHHGNGPRSSRGDPWLLPDAVETSGNNADAYVDHRAPDGLSTGDFRANTTGLRTFDWTYDTSADPLATVDQSKAAITQAFFTVNWLHDYWYDSGFNEAAGNAQHDNYGRGGVGGDAMRVEIQDNYFGGSRNNANMSTPADGIRPRMQMFVWTGRLTASLTLIPGGDRQTNTAAFGDFSFDVTAPIALANDGSGVSPTDACEPLVGNYTGLIVLVDRGTCTFVVKATNVQNAAAVGMIVANNAAGAAPGLGGADPTITIAILSLSQADGAALKTALLGGEVRARMFRAQETDRDSGLDNQIIAHEWGHYLHHRLADCGARQCSAMSEGWGDFLGLHLSARQGDNLDGTYSGSVYAARGVADSGYYGIRRAPYSVDFTKNGLTFKHISDGEPLPPAVLPGGPNSEVHNAGEIWASMLWESYVALLKTQAAPSGFDRARRRMSEYVVAGLQMTPPDATYTEQRDAILAAAAAGNRRSDVTTIAEAFARRGAGSCAISPPRTSINLVGVTESFDLRPRLTIGEIVLDDDRRSCDHDGYLDAGEHGRVAITVMNGGAAEAFDTVVTLTSPTAGITFPGGNSVMIARLRPFESVRVFVRIALDRAVTARGALNLQASVNNGEACQTIVTSSLNQWLNVDEIDNASATDDVEARGTSWTIGGTDGDQIWSRVEAAPLNRAWVGVDLPGGSDTTLESPGLDVSATSPFTITFEHRHSFEVDGTTFFDGGVIEISVDGGATWQDLNTIVNPGYGGTLFADSGNPLGGRSAFVARNALWPARNTVSLNLGNALAGQTVRVRFRIGTDEAVGDVGWELDNLAFGGITNTPFAVLVDETKVCKP